MIAGSAGRFAYIDPMILRLAAARPILAAGLWLAGSSGAWAAEPVAPASRLEPLVAAIEGYLDDGAILGAQLVVGTSSGVALEENFGVASPDRGTRVNSDTRFCIGSCSKPISAACILALAEAEKLDLDTPIDQWLPEFRGLKTEDGRRVEHAPTLRQLLAHRGGIFSQKRRMTQEQYAAIRSYDQTLEQAVATIARQRLLAEPGAEYAYSGAGYLVAGRVAEVATGQSFEQLLQRTICEPLAMPRTTFFPDPTFPIAVGGSRKEAEMSDDGAPHIAAHPLRLAFVSGGLYANAGDLERFCRMVLNQGRSDGRAVLSPATWSRFTARAFEDQAYGFGWHIRRNSSGATRQLSHTGVLSSYRSLMLIDFEAEASMVALWTLSEDDADEDEAGLAQELRETWLEIMD